MQGYFQTEDEPLVKDFWRDKIPASDNPFAQGDQLSTIHIFDRETIDRTMEIIKLSSGPTAILNKYKITHIINVPLLLDKEFFGSILFAMESDPALSDDDKELFMGLSRPLAIAVNNALIYEEMLQNEREKDILLNMTNSLMTIRNREQLLMTLARGNG